MALKSGAWGSPAPANRAQAEAKARDPIQGASHLHRERQSSAGRQCGPRGATEVLELQVGRAGPVKGGSRGAGKNHGVQGCLLSSSARAPCFRELGHWCCVSMELPFKSTN